MNLQECVSCPPLTHRIQQFPQREMRELQVRPELLSYYGNGRTGSLNSIHDCTYVPPHRGNAPVGTGVLDGPQRQRAVGAGVLDGPQRQRATGRISFKKAPSRREAFADQTAMNNALPWRNQHKTFPLRGRRKQKSPAEAETDVVILRHGGAYVVFYQCRLKNRIETKTQVIIALLESARMQFKPSDD